MKVITTTITDRPTPGTDQALDRLHEAADLLYAAECAFHDAYQTHIDAWIKAASGKLHSAVAAHLAAVAASNPASSTGFNL